MLWQVGYSMSTCQKAKVIRFKCPFECSFVIRKPNVIFGCGLTKNKQVRAASRRGGKMAIESWDLKKGGGGGGIN